MYVIFPADEVVYLSYGRLIVVPANSTPENSSAPIRTNSLPFENSSIDYPLNLSNSVRNKRSEILPSRIECNLDDQPSTSRGCNQNIEVSKEKKDSQEAKPKKKSLRLNFSLLRRKNSKQSETQSPLSSRVRNSVGHKDQSGISIAPSEAFKRFCHISSPEPKSNSTLPIPEAPQNSRDKEKSPSVQRINSQEILSSKRSSSSSKSGKPPIFQEEPGSKRSSKQSSSSSKSNKQEKSPLPNSISPLKRSQSQIQRDTRKDIPSRKTSTSTSENFYPLSTSREKRLEEPSPELLTKTRPSSLRSNLRRSKTPEVTFASQPPRPERRKEKKLVKTKSIPERKLSFSDFLPLGREKSSEHRPEVKVSSDRDKLQVESNKPAVLSFFRKTPSPKNLGRDRTPHLSRDSSFFPNPNLSYESQSEDISRPTNTGQKHASAQENIDSEMDKQHQNLDSESIIVVELSPNPPKPTEEAIPKTKRATPRPAKYCPNCIKQGCHKLGARRSNKELKPTASQSERALHKVQQGRVDRFYRQHHYYGFCCQSPIARLGGEPGLRSILKHV